MEPESPTKPPFFIVACLPRSRSAWLSALLSGTDAESVGHDVLVECGTMGDFGGNCDYLQGTVETAAMLGWRALRKTFPEFRLLVVRRDTAEVAESLARCGITVPHAELVYRAHLLDDLSAQDGVTTIPYSALGDPELCGWLIRELLGKEADPDWIAEMQASNIQIDIEARLAALRARSGAINALKAEAFAIEHDFPPGVLVTNDSFEGVWPEIRDLGQAHFEEVNDGATKRQYDPDYDLLIAEERAGSLLTFSARESGRLIGYLLFTIGPDPESKGLILGHHGPWYVAPGSPTNLGRRLLDWAIRELRARGVGCVLLHHQFHGRGARLSMLYERMGATPLHGVYEFWIGD